MSVAPESTASLVEQVLGFTSELHVQPFWFSVGPENLLFYKCAGDADAWHLKKPLPSTPS